MVDPSCRSDSVCAVARSHGAVLGKDKNFEEAAFNQCSFLFYFVYIVIDFFFYLSRK